MWSLAVDIPFDKLGEGFLGSKVKESNDEWNGEGNMLAFKYRIHNARLGRFLSVDPLAPEYPYCSTYPFASNTPIKAVELEGLEPGGLSGFANIGINVVFPYHLIKVSRSKKPKLELQSISVNLTGGVGHSIGKNFSANSTLSLSFSFGGKKETRLKGDVLFGKGENLDFAQEQTLLTGEGFSQLQRNTNLGESRFIGGGFAFDFPFANSNKSQGKLDIVGAFGIRSVDNGSTHPITGGALESSQFSANLKLENLFNASKLAVGGGISCQKRQFDDISAGLGFNFTEIGTSGFEMNAQGGLSFNLEKTMTTRNSKSLEIHGGTSVVKGKQTSEGREVLIGIGSGSTL